MTHPSTPQILIGTQNPGKVQEFREVLIDLPIRFVFPADAGVGDLNPDETGSTFEENAAIKALAFGQAARLPTIADDSGLVVDALDGRPGVYSARYGGAGLDARGRCELLLRELAGVPDERRTARFVAVIAFALPDSDTVQYARGVCEGRIAHAYDTEGKSGFGYDPLFIPDGYDRPFSSLPTDLKNRISHRARATQAVIPLLQAWLEA